MNRLVFLWCHPRSMSSTLERAKLERDDLATLHEPFLYLYYVHDARKAQSGAVSRSIAMSRGLNAPPQARRATPKRRRARSSQTARRSPHGTSRSGAVTGEPPGIDDASEPWRVALQAGPGALPGRADEAQRLQARRAETVLAATVGQPARRSRRLGRQRKASQGTLAALAAAPPVSLSEAADRPSALSYPTPAPGLRDADPGRGRYVLRACATRSDVLVATRLRLRCSSLCWRSAAHWYAGLTVKAPLPFMQWQSAR